MKVKIPNALYKPKKSKTKKYHLRKKSISPIQKNDIEKFFNEMIQDINGEITKVTQNKINEYKVKITKYIKDKNNAIPPDETNNNQEGQTSLTPKIKKRGRSKSLINQNIQKENKEESQFPAEVESKTNKKKSVPRKSHKKKEISIKEAKKTTEDKMETKVGIEISDGNLTMPKTNKKEKSENNNKNENVLVGKKRKRGQGNIEFDLNIIKSNEIKEELKKSKKGRSKSKQKGKKKTK